MADLVTDVGTHFRSLASDNEILTNFNATKFVANTNLFYLIEPDTPRECVTIIPYGGGPPDRRHRGAQTPAFQVRVKHTSVARGYRTTQAIINNLHMNDAVGSDIPMKVFAIQSAPMFMGWDEEDYPVYVCNFDVMLVKYTVS